MDEGLTRLLSGQMWGVPIEPQSHVVEMVLEIIGSGAMGPHLKGLEISLTYGQKGDLLCRVMEEKACIHLEELVVPFIHQRADRDKDGSIMSLLAQGESVVPHAT